MRSMEVQKEPVYQRLLILVATAADSPNVWLSVEYPNGDFLANEEKWNKVNEILLSVMPTMKSWTPLPKDTKIRTMVDHKIVQKVIYK